MARYAVGIDLGTSNTVLAYAALGADGQAGPVTLFDVDQLIAPGEVAALPLLPSVRYQAGAGELADADLQLPWAAAEPMVVGTLARKLGAQVPGRLVASAKSWLSHAGVDRMASILPWGSAPDVPKVSPVDASASYLRHLRSAWNHRFPDDPLEQQDLVLTVPASFDEAARALTLAAARAAGLPALRLLEEPQAVFYDWLQRHRATLASELAGTRLVLVCDVGGGTTDLSLIKVELRDGHASVTRIGVGNHLMLGGDNMDTALAHLAESRLAGDSAGRLSASRLSQLVERCRAAKEQLLAADAPDQVNVTLLGAGARLIGGARSATLTREEVERLIVDGFLPQVDAGAPLLQRRAGIVEFGLPYARDPAITRHVADFLRRHADAVREATAGAAPVPDTLLLNGGVFRASALAERLEQTLGAWRGAPLRVLHNDDPDVAVARGAVAYALAGVSGTPKIGGGAARSYFLLLDEGKRGARRAICILPRGSEAGHELRLDAQNFALRVGEPVRFHLFTSNADAAGRAPFALGELVDLDDGDFARLPPIAMVLRAPGRTRREVPVQLASALTEVGTLEMHCVSVDDAAERWLLEFDLRQHDDVGDEALDDGGAAARLALALPNIERIFGAKAQQVPAKEVKQLRAQLEQVLGERANWSTPLLRQLFDALWLRAKARRRSPEHERLWLNLAGFCLRPGFGFALDDWRLQQLWTLFEAGVAHGADKQVQAEWWTLWRRVAGGLDAEQQRRLLDDFAANLQINEGGDDDTGALVRGSDDDMLRLGASLERIPPAFKVEIGEWLLARLGKANDALTLWALGRIGARQPFYGNLDDLVPADVVATWLDAILALDWRRLEPAAFAAAYLARMTGDRARDLPLALRETIAARLRQVAAPAIWIRMVEEVVALDEATERRVLGETLPPGLKLIGETLKS
ncbi:molecular chaperone DnaK [Massilia eurypsychrophila]|uniref:Molecular chaperone DnaK n=1 Tax=Massilia eurypsychrophila TaxID=1485217 RepID=A0A2G8TM36_9BURK|nr:Hsp70 family protein [Massilia eurypsychrophila]PIL47103.1 molecular chaperone DnaK [Massilia eurypsychrophila]